MAEVGGQASVEAGGGLRTPGHVAAALAGGVARVVLGTAAITDPGLLAEIVAEHGSARIVVAVDVRDGLALGEGWRPGRRRAPARTS